MEVQLSRISLHMCLGTYTELLTLAEWTLNGTQVTSLCKNVGLAALNT